jgi:hypothetical protein
MSVLFNIHATVGKPQDFDELRKLYEEMRSYYAIHCGSHDYVVNIHDAGPPGGYVASGLRVNLKDWRVQFTRGTPESIDTSERKDE